MPMLGGGGGIGGVGLPYGPRGGGGGGGGGMHVGPGHPFFSDRYGCMRSQLCVCAHVCMCMIQAHRAAGCTPDWQCPRPHLPLVIVASCAVGRAACAGCATQSCSQAAGLGVHSSRQADQAGFAGTQSVGVCQSI